VQIAPLDSFYGSDRTGLIWGYAFAPPADGQPIDPNALGSVLEAVAATTGSFAWLHFSLANAASSRWLRDHVELPDAFFEALEAHSSTRIELAPGGLLGVVNDMPFLAAEASTASTVTLYVTERLLISARTTPLRAIDRLRAAVKNREPFRSPAALLAHLLRDQADVLSDVVRDVTKKVDGVEDRIMTNRSASRPQLGNMRRTLVRLQRLLSPEPAALFRLLSRPPDWLLVEDVSDLRGSAEELAAAVADSVSLVERIRLLQEELSALLNEQTNRTLFVLTVVTVVALPMTIIPGLFGMNVGGVPLADHQAGFWVVSLIVVLLVGLAAALAWTRSRPD
jgi:zinc transporter